MIDWKIRFSDCISPKGQTKKNLSEDKRMEIYLYRLKQIGKNIKPLSFFSKVNQKIEHKCLDCGFHWIVSPKTITTSKCGCPKCAGNAPLKLDEYISTIKNKPIDYVEGFGGSKKKCLHKCSVCSREWLITPYEVKNGVGCGKCSNKVRWTTKEYIEKASLNERKISVLEPYVSSLTKIRHLCGKCGHEWRTKPAWVLTNRGCPNCANRMHDCLYYWVDSNGFFKIGISKKGKVEDRANRVAYNRDTEILTLRFVDTNKARDHESFLLSKFKDMPYRSGEGYTEFRSLSSSEKKELDSYFDRIITEEYSYVS